MTLWELHVPLPTQPPFFPVLGSDLTGYVNLYPLLIDDDKEVYVSCTSYGVFHAGKQFLQPNIWYTLGVNLACLKWCSSQGNVGKSKATDSNRVLPNAQQLRS